MELRKFEKKLVLNKKTIADLSIGEMGKIRGGDIKTYFCPITTYSHCLSICGGAAC